MAVGWIKVALIDSSLIICLFLTLPGPFDYTCAGKTVNNQSIIQDITKELLDVSTQSERGRLFTLLYATVTQNGN